MMNQMQSYAKKALKFCKAVVGDKIYTVSYKKRKVVRKVINLLTPHAKPDLDEIVGTLARNIASLEMKKSDSYDLAPISGTCGSITVTGGLLSVFEYRVFEKKLMEFIKVRVEVAMPSKMHFICTIDAKGHTDNARHGEEVEVKQAYKDPFEKLALQLFNYFPYYKKD